MKNLHYLALALLLTACGSTPPNQSSPTAGVTGLKTKPYPLKTCIVTDNDLYSMGTPVSKVYNGQEVKFCCRPCVGEFEGNQARYLQKI